MPDEVAAFKRVGVVVRAPDSVGVVARPALDSVGVAARPAPELVAMFLLLEYEGGDATMSL